MSGSDAVASYGGTAAITVTATDPAGAGEAVSGVREVICMLDDDAPVVVPGDEAAVTTSEEGAHTLGFFATDNAGNEEAPHNTVTFTVTANAGSITRVFGADRFATAIEASKASFTSADAVIIATGMNYRRALGKRARRRAQGPAPADPEGVPVPRRARRGRAPRCRRGVHHGL
ncbi:MAG: cell wall-binding repeat-containing protein [Coriobacteriia bacterium]|nr:cell wall-binding repeat-containing protein [Coriobacteriia bacterium]